MQIGVFELLSIAQPAQQGAPNGRADGTFAGTPGGSFAGLLNAALVAAVQAAKGAGASRAIAGTRDTAEASPDPAAARPAVAGLGIAAAAAGAKTAASASPAAATLPRPEPGPAGDERAVAVAAASAAAVVAVASGDGPKEAEPDPAAAAPAADAGQAPPAKRPARHHAMPAGASARPAGAQAEAAPAGGDGPQAAANDQASGVREAALTVARERLAPGHAARGGEAPPDSTAFRDTLASVLPDNAGHGPAEGARAPAQAAPALAARAPATPMPIAEQVAVHIRQAVADGDSVVRIHLEPKELGRIDVRLEISEGGRLSAVVTAERPDTLDLLARDARGLEKALADAGLDVDSDSLAFDLGERAEGDGEADGKAGGEAVEADVLAAAAPAHAWPVTGIDISV